MWYSVTKFWIFGLNCIQLLIKPVNYHIRSAITWKRYMKINKFFGNWEFCFIKTKISRKPRIFQDEILLALWFFLTGFLNFGWKSRHPTLKFKPWLVIWRNRIGAFNCYIIEIKLQSKYIWQRTRCTAFAWIWLCVLFQSQGSQIVPIFSANP